MDRRLLADTRPLANTHFRRLWLANIVTVIGAQLTVVAVPAQIYAMTGSSAYVGLTGVFGLVPLVVFGLWGGALADAFDRRLLLMITTTGLILTAAGSTTLITCVVVVGLAAGADMPTVGGNLGNQHYSGLTQIGKDNLKQLAPAWRTHVSASGSPSAKKHQAAPHTYSSTWIRSTTIGRSTPRVRAST